MADDTAMSPFFVDGAAELIEAYMRAASRPGYDIRNKAIELALHLANMAKQEHEEVPATVEQAWAKRKAIAEQMVAHEDFSRLAQWAPDVAEFIRRDAERTLS